jgi:hypothetical protein
MQETPICRGSKGISNGATQTDIQRPFASVMTENAFGPCSSGAMQSDRAVRGDANLVQICVRFASP